MSDYESLKIANLRELAKERNITGYLKLKKSELIDALRMSDNDDSEILENEDENIESEIIETIDSLDNNTNDNLANLEKNADGLFIGENNSISGGVLEILPDGYGFLRGTNYLSTENDVYMSPTQIRRFRMKTGDYIDGIVRPPKSGEKFSALLYVHKINGEPPEKSIKRVSFDNLIPVYPNQKFNLNKSCDISSRIVDIIAPIGKGQRGLIVAPPKAGKTTLIKSLANAIKTNNPEVEMIILLIDERPEEVTDIKEYVKDADVIYSTFDELPSHHVKVAEMVLNRAKGLVEFKKDVVILLDSITRLARAYNITIQSSGKTLSGGLDPSSLYGPKQFFGAARNFKDNGSLTILATALIDTGSRMDDVIFEEFKGTGNMELVLDRKLSQKRIFPAIDVEKSGTRKDELLQSKKEMDFATNIRKNVENSTNSYYLENLIKLMGTMSNEEIIEKMSKQQ